MPSDQSHGAIQRNVCNDPFAKISLYSMTTNVPLTPESFKAVAHPLRVALLALLRMEGPATASQLAEILDTSSGATSYHLRQLAKHGFIVEDANAGSARERYWIAANPVTEFDPKTLSADPEAAELFHEVMRTVSLNRESEVQGFLATQDQWGPEWDEGIALDDYFVTVTAQELAEIHREIATRLVALSERSAENEPEGTVPVRIHLLAFPVASPREGIKRIAERWE